jgi:hypothetical protein
LFYVRVLREIDVLRQEATLLQEQMRTVRGDIQKVNQDTADGMRNLIELDLVKNRIQSASKALQEADNWVTLSAQIDDTFESKDTVQVRDKKDDSNNHIHFFLIMQIATKLIAMQQSLKILTDVPDYADRVNRLETLKNRLEALMSPTVVAAFNTQDVGMNTHFPLVFLVILYTKYFYRNGSVICTSLSINGPIRTIRRFICNIRQSKTLIEE